MKQMKVWSAGASALVLLGLASTAQAGISSTITLTNDYDFRGVSQSAEDPALQASIDYADESSGWYVGAWASNVDFSSSTVPANADLELDLYTGFTGKTDQGLGWDAGFVYYTYDEDRFNFPEIFAAFSYSYFKAKLAYSNDFGGRDTPGHTSAWYTSVDAAVPLPVKDLTATAHLGYSAGDYWSNHTVGGDYFDYSVGVGYVVNQFNLSLKYVDTNASPHTYADELNNQGRFVFAVSTTLPWKK